MISRSSAGVAAVTTGLGSTVVPTGAWNFYAEREETREHLDVVLNERTQMNIAKDLTKEPPRSLCQRIGGYAVLARMADKGRATLNGTAGEYHFNCPLDNMLFSFKGVQAEDVKNLLASGAADEQVAAWFDVHGIPKTVDEIKAWSDSVEAIQPYQNPEQRKWFASECARLGLDPVKSRFCDYLDTDDRVSFAK
jgi:hypothetical protein